MSSSKVQDFYKGKNVFITGVTGFVGTILLEKVLRTIPNLGTVYLLIRAKSGKPALDRLDEIKKCPIFEKLLETKTINEVFSKVKVVQGDVQHELLGLSAEDRKELIENVNVTFHVAATIDFADTLKTCLRSNLLGTRKMLDLCKETNNLDVFVYVSSSYAQTWTMCPEEKIYDLNEDVDKLLGLAETLSDEEFKDMTPLLLGPHPHPYTMSKYFAELEVAKCHKLFPCTIVRPSVIGGTWQDPKPNYAIGPLGPHGVLQGLMRGVLRRMPGSMDLIIDYIPVDIVVNNLIVAGSHMALTKPKETTVYNCTSSTRNPFRWRDVLPFLNRKSHVLPFLSAVWYPYTKIMPSYLLFKVSALIFHILPSLFLDGLLIVTGEKPKLFEIHIEALRMYSLFTDFLFREWLFDSEKSQALHEWLSNDEKKLFNLDISTLSWPYYFWGLAQGIRKYECNESLDNLKAAKKKHTILKILHIFVQVVVMLLVWAAICAMTEFSLVTTLIFVPIYHYIFNVLL